MVLEDGGAVGHEERRLSAPLFARRQGFQCLHSTFQCLGAEEVWRRVEKPFPEFGVQMPRLIPEERRSHEGALWASSGALLHHAL